MTYSLSEQSVAVLFALCFGVALGLIYDVFRILCAVFRKYKYFQFVSDVCFMLIFTFSTVIFSIGFYRGNPRYFIILGEIIGILGYRFTVGRVSLRVFRKIIEKIRRILKFFTDFFIKNTKKLLHLRHKMLYNKHRKKGVITKHP